MPGTLEALAQGPGLKTVALTPGDADFAPGPVRFSFLVVANASNGTVHRIEGSRAPRFTAPAVVNSVMAGSDATIIAGGVTSLNYYLQSRADIKTPEQLKGGSVAISRISSPATR